MPISLIITSSINLMNVVIMKYEFNEFVFNKNVKGLGAHADLTSLIHV